ncbi:ArsR family transcriptional regulator [Peredibacter sp. HCB2-198]|uniref:ArsR family transcriptional regulator n=1 Tax=Peredibacter sp. HCB2-198 TaxID=3383025 RepID=UPI0038B5B4D4
MIETIFGNVTAAKIMLYLFHYGEAYASGISKDMGVALSQVQKQLDRFEEGGILVSKLMGKVRIYTFNPKIGVTKKLKELIQIFYDSIPLEQKEQMFSERRRPRRRNKPVLSKVDKNRA